MKGRQIFGDIVPFGHAWITGENRPVTIKTGEDLEIEGFRIKAGEYVVYTVPGKEKWEVVFSTATGDWTAGGFARQYDVARFKIKPMQVEAEYQNFTIEITDITYSTCKIELMWEHTKVTIPIIARNGNTIAASIDNAINVNDGKPLPYFEAATYYYETNQKMDVAERYVDAAVAQAPTDYKVWYLKARIEKKLDHMEEALMSAKKSIELSRGTAQEWEYRNYNEKIIKELLKEKRRVQPAD